VPILARYKWLYPIDWPQLSALVRFERAEGRCQRCGRPHGQEVRHLGDGRWWDEDRQAWRSGNGRLLPHLPALIADHRAILTTRVILAAAHLDHDPTNNRLRNLRAFCQRCHLQHDRAEHQRRRSRTLRMRKALGDLFLGPYRLE
jgi:5-methylcytosine-specific restriction endonuclease McrA